MEKLLSLKSNYKFLKFTYKGQIIYMTNSIYLGPEKIALGRTSPKITTKTVEIKSANHAGTILFIKTGKAALTKVFVNNKVVNNL